MLRGIESVRDIMRAWANDTAVPLLGVLVSTWAPAQRVIAEFREVGAVTPHRAQRFHAASTAERQAFQRLLSLGVIRQPAYGRYYLNERSLETLRGQLRLPEL